MTFSSKSNLTSHMRSHTREQPFECVICSKRISYKANLITH